MGLPVELASLIKIYVSRSHKIIFFLIAALALGTFVFGILQLIGAGQAKPARGPLDARTNLVNH